jgi:hypothetical protein
MTDSAASSRRRRVAGGFLQGLGLVSAVVAGFAIGSIVGLVALGAALFVTGWALDRSAG